MGAEYPENPHFAGGSIILDIGVNFVHDPIAFYRNITDAGMVAHGPPPGCLTQLKNRSP